MKSSLRKALKTKSNQRWRGGPKCFGCNLKAAKQVDRDIKDFMRAKRRGHPMPWTAFVRDYLAPEYKINIRPATLWLHAQRCLGL
jgi:hypothetical protein